MGARSTRKKYPSGGKVAHLSPANVNPDSSGIRSAISVPLPGSLAMVTVSMMSADDGAPRDRRLCFREWGIVGHRAHHSLSANAAFGGVGARRGETGSAIRAERG